MWREQCDLERLFKIGRQGLVLVFGGLIVTIASGVTVSSLAIEPIPSIAQANPSVEAFQLRQQGVQLVQEGSKESLRQAVLIFEKASELSLSVNDREFEALDYLQIGSIYIQLDNKLRALELFQQALGASMRKEVRDAFPNKSRLNEALARTRIGAVHDDSPGEEQKALDFYQQALTILREKEIVKEFPETSRYFEALVLYNIGMIYGRLGKSQQALEYLEQSLSLNVKLSDPIDQARRFNNICSVLRDHGQNQRAFNFCNEALRISREESVRKVFVEKSRLIEAIVLQNIGDVYRNLGENQKALEAYNQALEGYQNKMVRDKFPEESSMEEAKTYNQIGLIYLRLNRIELALSVFEKSLALKQGLRDFAGQSITLQNIGESHSTLNRQQEAWDSYSKALAISRSVDFRKASPAESLRSEAAALKSMGTFQRKVSDYQQALDFFEAALKIVTEKGYREAYPAESRKFVAVVYNDIGLVYQEFGQLKQALVGYESALATLKEQVVQNAFPLESRLIEVKIFNNLGTLYQKLCLIEKPLEQTMHCYMNRVVESFNNASRISREREIRQAFPEESLELEIVALNNIAQFLNSVGKNREALSTLDLALPLSRELQNRYLEAFVLNGKGFAHYKLSDDLSALDSYSKSLSLTQAVGDKNLEVWIRTNISVLYKRQGSLLNALAQTNAAIEMIESLRGKIRNDDLKMSYFETTQGIYAHKIDLLMQLHKQQPQKSYDRQALETSDRARARSLIELLTESRADVRKGVRKDLLDREKKLQQELNAAEKRLTQLASNASTQAGVAGVQQEIKVLNQAQTQLKDDIRRESPAYAALKYPEPLKFAEIQQQLDPDTVLLQYSLGEERSYLWVVSNTGAPKSYTLDSRAKIEAAANNFRDNILRVRFNRPADINRLGNELRELIIPEAAVKQLTGKRLVIAADGVLHFIPFASLPDPNAGKTSDYIPLLKSHEIVNVPSMSALIALREKVRQRQPAPKKLAILADPVFSPKDDRLQQALGSRHTAASRSADSITLASTAPTGLSFSQQIEQSQSQRVLSDCNLDYQSLRDLPETGETAKQIASLISAPQQITKRLGLEANKEWLMDDQRSRLDQYQMLLLATHGCASSTNPQLSRLFLSRFNEQGQPISDALQLGDIFNLNLSAELVVLSACDTGLGKDLRGEGIIGLTRGFMYAGAERIVTSLWSVSAEQGTPELMEAFFAKMLRPNQPLSPSAALRAAQREVWQKNHNPYYWAAFTLQGEWRSEN